MSLHNRHNILTKAEDILAAKDHVLRFFTKNMLISYDHIDVQEEFSFQASDQQFWTVLDQGVSDNKLKISTFIKELKESGISDIDDLSAMQQGYQSKLLHIITHLLDGFVSIDSVFYNLLEDSHFISPALKQKIQSNPSHYWLLHITASFKSPKSASLIHANME